MTKEIQIPVRSWKARTTNDELCKHYVGVVVHNGELVSYHVVLVLTKDKRESPRLQSWDESTSMFFLILDISDYGISRNASDRLAEIRTRPQRRQTGAQLCKFLTQNSR